MAAGSAWTHAFDEPRFAREALAVPLAEQLHAEAAEAEFDQEQLESLRQRRCRALLQWLSTVPRFRDTAAALAAADDAVAAVARFPLTSRRDIRTSLRAFVSDRRGDDWFRLQTSGSSGIPMTTIADGTRVAEGIATSKHRLGIYGVPVGYRRVVFTMEPQQPSIRWSFSIADGYASTWTVNLFPTSRPAKSELVALFENLRPHVLQTQPSQLLLFLAMLTEAELRRLARTAPVVASWGEGWFPPTRRDVERAGLRVFDSYGMMEVGLVATQCELQQLYHLESDRFHFELVEPDGAHEPTEQELVFTRFLGRSQAFVRYRSGDVTTTPARCPCGRASPAVAAISTTKGHLLVLADGTESTPYFLREPFLQLQGIEALSFVQREPGRVVVRLTGSIDETALGAAVARMRDLVDGALVVEAERVDDIQALMGERRKVLLYDLMPATGEDVPARPRV